MLVVASGYRCRYHKQTGLTVQRPYQIIACRREWQVTVKLHLVAAFKSESDTYFSLCMKERK